MALATQIGTAIRIEARKRVKRSHLVKREKKSPRLTPDAFTLANIPDSWTRIRRTRSMSPMIPPTQKAQRQSRSFATRFPTTAPETPTDATIMVP